MTQIGLLLPRSTIFPGLNFDFADGLKAGLAAAGVKDVEIKTAGIGVGGSEKDIYSACEKLIFDGAEIVVGYLNATTAAMMQPLFINSGTLLIMLDAGYHIPHPGYKQQHIFTLSLDGTLACRLLPTHAASKGDTKLAYACSFYDSGYRSAFGIFNGAVDTGSEITFTHVTKLLKAEFTIDPLTDFLKANPTAALMAAFCGDMTEDLFRGMEAEEEYSRHNIYAAPFVAEETWLAKSPYPGNYVTSLVAWGSGLDNAENAAFMAALKKKRTPNVFSLLAWEAAMLVAKALPAEGAADRIAALEGYTFASPRGTVTIDRETHNSHAPLYEATIVENEANGMCSLRINTTVDAAQVASARAKLGKEIESVSGALSSWYNAYACLD